MLPKGEMMIATLMFNDDCRFYCLRLHVVAALLTIGTTASLLAEPAAAVVLVNDTWKDGLDTDPAAPTYAENNGAVGNDADADGDLESAWFQGGAGMLNPVGPNGPQRGDLTGTDCLRIVDHVLHARGNAGERWPTKATHSKLPGSLRPRM